MKKGTEQKIYTPLTIMENGGMREIVKKEREWLLGGYDLEWKYYKDAKGNFILERS